MTSAAPSPPSARDPISSAAGGMVLRPSRELTLSPSRIKTFLQCPACFSAMYVEGRAEPRRSIAMPLGAGVHAGAAASRRAKQYGEKADLNNALAIAEAAFKSSLAGESEPGYSDGQPPLEWDLGKYSDMSSPLDDCLRLTQKVIEEVVSREPPALQVEQELDYSGVFDGFDFRGTIDVRLPLGEGEEIRDLKSAARQAAPDDYTALQMAMYGLPDWAVGREVMLGVDVIAKTKAADIQRYDLFVDNDQYARVYGIVTDAAAHIAAGDFPPRPQSPFRCRFDHGLPHFSLPVSWPEPA